MNLPGLSLVPHLPAPYLPPPPYNLYFCVQYLSPHPSTYPYLPPSPPPRPFFKISLLQWKCWILCRFISDILYHVFLLIFHNYAIHCLLYIFFDNNNIVISYMHIIIMNLLNVYHPAAHLVLFLIFFSKQRCDINLPMEILKYRCIL